MLEDVRVEVSSETLSAQLRDGSRDALAEAYERWAPLIHTIALRALGDHHDAEDVTQQVFVSAWRSRETLRAGPTALPGWLVGIAKHRIGDVRAQRFRSVRDTLAVAATLGTELGATSDAVDGLVVRHELDGLDEPRGTVLRLFLLEDRSHEDIAEQLGMPLGTVKSHIRRGIIRLRDSLEEVNDVPS